ncbi:hypothetical protein ACQBAT_14740 [Ornithinimicrobium sp. Y1847]|uniref:hypothetical protein n=1 Tax=Ornithinimicrobium sp. Y1847 TaxID=3405419 RepID=UPI003B6704E8
MSFTVASIPVPDLDAPLPQDILDLVEVERAHHRRLYGHEDLVHPARAVALGLTRQESTRRERLLARDDSGRAVGAAHVTMPVRDNQHLGFFFPSWDPTSGAPFDEVHDTLWAAAEHILTEHGRTSVSTWAMHPESDVEDGPVTWLEPSTGSGQVLEDRRARWFAAHGFTLEQVQLYSVLDLADLPAQPAAQGGVEGSASHTAYRTRVWEGATARGAARRDGAAAQPDERGYPDRRRGLRRGAVGRGAGCRARRAARGSGGPAVDHGRARPRG